MHLQWMHRYQRCRTRWSVEITSGLVFSSSVFGLSVYASRRDAMTWKHVLLERRLADGHRSVPLENYYIILSEFLVIFPAS